MAVCVFNTLSRKKEELVPVAGKTLNMYSCGVTVYDSCHLGHARSLYTFDVIRRYLVFRGYAVRFIRNITDIDDKIIQKANARGLSAEAVAAENIRSYQADLTALGVSPADVEPKATENIPEMIAHIVALIQKGYAYQANGDVYFAVREFKGYGRLSGQGIEKMREAVRIEKGEAKKDPLDFALWKRSKPGEPAWPSPWGEGRPGWHIECSAMSMKYLKTETLDIHAGGLDLVFPHHENEVAQSEALTGKPFAKYWLHHGLLTINGQKMAKSLGNFITIQDALTRYAPAELKLFFLLSHYASPVDFTDEKMQEVKKGLERLRIFGQEAKRAVGQKAPRRLVMPQNLAVHREEFFKAMDDDFNTPKALGAAFALVNDVYQHKNDAGYSDLIVAAQDLIEELMGKIFGIALAEESSALSAEEKTLLEERQKARDKKDFQEADRIRDTLKARGIIVEDGKDGQTWRKS